MVHLLLRARRSSTLQFGLFNFAERRWIMPRPVHEIRIGRVKAVIWPNETEQGAVRHNVTLARLYKDGDQWKESTSFGRDDLPVVQEVARDAFRWIYANSQIKREAAPVETEEYSSFAVTTEDVPF
jgi:hypothetical protein